MLYYHFVWNKKWLEIKKKIQNIKFCFKHWKYKCTYYCNLFNYRIIAYDKTRFNLMFKLFCLIYYYLVLLLQNLLLFTYSYITSFTILLIFSVSMVNIIQTKYNIIYKLVFLDSKQRVWLWANIRVIVLFTNLEVKINKIWQLRRKLLYHWLTTTCKLTSAVYSLEGKNIIL